MRRPGGNNRYSFNIMLAVVMLRQQKKASRGVVVDCTIEGSIDKGNDIVDQRIQLVGENSTSTGYDTIVDECTVENELSAGCEGVLHNRGSASGSRRFIDIRSGWHEGIERSSGQQVQIDLAVDDLLDINHIRSVEELMENEIIGK
ncbi:Uncharacterized protein Fot_12923 [Forsythia ovata]|uniref:Uncharacterized protein n=1 Tax=Forsythia ovata TaxID=205694 RepID=A0ABD1W1Z9_9LAMI